MITLMIKRRGVVFGPYSLGAAQRFLSEGSLLPNDLAKVAGSEEEWDALASALRRFGSTPPRSSAADRLVEAVRHLRTFDYRLLLPIADIMPRCRDQNRRALALAALGLAPLGAISAAGEGRTAYWAIGLYFSLLWALFFFHVFRTPEIKPQICAACFAFTAVVGVAVLVTFQAIIPSAWLVVDAAEIVKVNWAGMLVRVAIPEELCKAAVIIWLANRPGLVLLPQSLVVYGLMSGLGFGVYEGVDYQVHINHSFGAETAYFLNIARLTSLPFIHAVWSGISAYFIAFGALNRRQRPALLFFAIGIPALLHATYNVLSDHAAGILVAAFSVLLLLAYLARASELQRHLRAPKVVSV